MQYYDKIIKYIKRDILWLKEVLWYEISFQAFRK